MTRARNLPSSRVNGTSESPAGQRLLVLVKVARILDAFERHGPDLTATQVRDFTGIPMSTVARLLSNLTTEGFLDRNEGLYWPGPRLHFWGTPGVADRQFARTAQPVLDHLRDETGETALLFVREGQARTIVALSATRHTVVYTLTVGQLLPLHAGSSGRVLLAFDQEAAEQVLAGDLTTYTSSTIAEPEKLRRDLARVRRAGVAISRGERNLGAAGISSPVLDAEGTIVAAVGVAGPLQRFTDSHQRKWSPLVIGAGRTLSRSIAQPGSAGPEPFNVAPK